MHNTSKLFFFFGALVLILILVYLVQDIFFYWGEETPRTYTIMFAVILGILSLILLGAFVWFSFQTFTPHHSKLNMKMKCDSSSSSSSSSSDSDDEEVRKKHVSFTDRIKKILHRNVSFTENGIKYHLMKIADNLYVNKEDSRQFFMKNNNSYLRISDPAYFQARLDQIKNTSLHNSIIEQFRLPNLRII